MGSEVFNERLSLGAIGESYVMDYLRRAGCQVYTPSFEGSHCIDFFVVAPDGLVFGADVKTYRRRAKYNDTGIDTADWLKYAQIALKTPVRLFFVDSFERCCYSCRIPIEARTEADKTYIDLSNMRIEFSLTDSQVKAIEPATHWSYADVEPFFKYEYGGFRTP